MDDTYGEFQGTELDPSLDFDFEDDEENDLLPILGLAAFFAAVVGGVLVLVGRRHQPTAAERVQEALGSAGDDGKKALKAASKAVESSQLGDLLDEALNRVHELSSNGDAHKLLRSAQKRAGDVASSGTVQDVLDEARSRAKQAQKRAKKAAKNIDLGDAGQSAQKRAADLVASVGLADLLAEAISRAGDAAKHAPDLRDSAADARKRVAKAVSDSPLGDVDTDNAGKFLDDLKEKIVEVIDQLRAETAPKAAEAIKTQVVPTVQETAQNIAQRVQEDVLPAAQDAVGKFADQYDVAPRARKVADVTKSGALNFSDLLRGLGLAIASRMVEEVFPEAKKQGSRLVTKAREDVLPAAADTASQAAATVREDVLPRVGEVASQTPDMLGDLLAMAREKVGEAIDKSSPVVADAAGAVAHKAGSGAKSLAASSKGGAKGVGGAVSSAGRGVTGAVGAAVDATTSATRELSGILFWLAALGGLILLVFVPDREKQDEIWTNIRQFLGEVREMWRDMQSPEFELESGDTEDTSTS